MTSAGPGKQRDAADVWVSRVRGLVISATVLVVLVLLAGGAAFGWTVVDQARAESNVADAQRRVGQSNAALRAASSEADILFNSYTAYQRTAADDLASGPSGVDLYNLIDKQNVAQAESVYHDALARRDSALSRATQDQGLLIARRLDLVAATSGGHTLLIWCGVAAVGAIIFLLAAAFSLMRARAMVALARSVRPDHSVG